ncbi:MAG: CRTAC1 family protein [Chromatiales bacterium]|nr:CRTAC1 family protein [Chromatiales bacterium]
MLVFASVAFAASASEPATTGPGGTRLLSEVQDTIRAIGTLEDRRDPKCHATASRLEDFMYGTPLTDAARYAKLAMQKRLAHDLLDRAEVIAREHGAARIEQADVDLATAALMQVDPRADGGFLVSVAGRPGFEIRSDDHRQYATVAYGLRALLAVQHDALIAANGDRLALADDAVARLKRDVELATLVVLQTADLGARLQGAHQLTDRALQAAWENLFGDKVHLAEKPAAPTDRVSPPNYAMTRNIIAQKFASYEAYNHVSNAVFLRNIQVYFSRHRWPVDEAQSNALKISFTEAMIQIAAQLLHGAERRALARGESAIRVEDIGEYSKAFVPYEMNEYEDAIFFPRLSRAERIVLEAYDMDAFRDGGLHWRYLEAVINAADFAPKLEPDPFALELVVESIAQIGVLVLRVAGELSAQLGHVALSADDIDQSLRRIQSLIDRHARIAAPADSSSALVSAPASGEGDVGAYFSDVTAASGIVFEHRLADWLGRAIRSYSVRKQEVAVLAVPPAFGGSGAAAEDIDADGRPDVLLVGGAGNRLFRNLGGGRFQDITREAGIDWRRPEDGLPGEPRQPIIADFDNDGLPDVFISYADDDHRMYRNVGNARFVDVTATTGLGGKGLVGGPATAFDYDRDGRLDLYIGYFGQYTEGTIPTLARRNDNGLPNRLFRNVGGLRFENVTDGSGLDNTGWTQALSHTDIDRDGWQDLIVGNDFGVNAYYRNRGDGTFEDISTVIGTGKPSFTMGIGLSDLNGDLHPDVYISNIVTMDKDQKYVLPDENTPMKFDAKTMSRMRVIEANDLFVSGRDSSGALHYKQSDAIGRGLEATGWAWGADFLDFDNDGDDDLYVGNGMNDFAVYSAENPYYSDPRGNTREALFADSHRDANVFYENRDGRLVNASRASGADLLGNTRAVVYLDMDDDGDLDMILNNFAGPAVVYRNNAESRKHHWLKVSLQGDPAQGVTRDAIGARVLVETAAGPRRWREIHGSVGYLTMHPKEQHVGLGDATEASIIVEWPNGTTSRFENLAANVRYRIDQATGSIARVQGRDSGEVKSARHAR